MAVGPRFEFVGGISDAESVPNLMAKSASGDASHTFSVDVFNRAF
jgi:hypothetical protein